MIQRPCQTGGISSGTGCRSFTPTTTTTGSGRSISSDTATMSVYRVDAVSEAQKAPGD